MSKAVEHKYLAGLLRSYFLMFPELPVPAGHFSLDGLQPTGASMSLQITGGQTVRRYINGNRSEMLAFTIFYRDAARDDKAKSAMLGVLNGIGAWVEESEPPYLGDSFNVRSLEQAQTANVVAQTEKSITYQAGFVLAYTTN